MHVLSAFPPSGRTPRKLTWWSSRLAPLAAIALALTFAFSEGKAQPPGLGETGTAQGRLQSLTSAPMGEIDGAVLDDGTAIHWPPHLADRVRGTPYITPQGSWDSIHNSPGVGFPVLWATA